MATEVVCKIRRYGTVYAAFAGMLQEDTGFNVYKIATAAMAACGNPECATKAFTAPLRTPMLAASRAVKRTFGQEYFRKHFVVQALIFGGSQDRRHSVHMLTVTIKESADLNIAVDRCSEDCQPDRTIYYVIGQYSGAASYLKMASQGTAALEPVTIIREFLRTESQDDPYVGPPFAILKLEDSVAHWVNHGACPVK